MAKKLKPYNLVRKIVVQLRAIHRGWPPANTCLKNARKDKKWYCEACDKGFRKEYLRKDHINPIGSEPKLINGVWVPTWDTYINSVFCDLGNYQALCLDCHEVKTKQEKLDMALKRKNKE